MTIRVRFGNSATRTENSLGSDAKSVNIQCGNEISTSLVLGVSECNVPTGCMTLPSNLARRPFVRPPFS